MCGQDLLSPKPTGILVLWEGVQEDLQRGDDIVDVHWCCRGRCDAVLEKRIKAKHGVSIVDGWEDLSDLCIPVVFLQRLMAILNGFQNGDQWSQEAFDKLKTILIAVYQNVSRDASTMEMDRIKQLMDLPDYVGGLGRE